MRLSIYQRGQVKLVKVANMNTFFYKQIFTEVKLMKIITNKQLNII